MRPSPDRSGKARRDAPTWCFAARPSRARPRRPRRHAVRAEPAGEMSPTASVAQAPRARRWRPMIPYIQIIRYDGGAQSASHPRAYAVGAARRKSSSAARQCSARRICRGPRGKPWRACVRLRQRVPAAMLDRHPGLCAERLEADLDLGRMVRPEVRRPPRKAQALAAHPGADAADLETLAARRSGDKALAAVEPQAAVAVGRDGEKRVRRATRCRCRRQTRRRRVPGSRRRAAKQ